MVYQGEQRRKIIEALTNNKEVMTPKEIAAATDIAHHNVQVTLRRMVEDRQVVQISRGKYTVLGTDGAHAAREAEMMANKRAQY